MTLPFNRDYAQFRREYDTVPVYTRKQYNDALQDLARKLTINRVIQSFTGLYGPTETRAMQILAIHQTEEGTLVIVK